MFIEAMKKIRGKLPREYDQLRNALASEASVPRPQLDKTSLLNTAAKRLRQTKRNTNPPAEGIGQ